MKVKKGSETASRILKCLHLNNCCSDVTEFVCESLCDTVIVSEDDWQRIKTFIENFPKPWISTDYTHLFDGAIEALAKGEPLPEHETKDYPRHYREPTYEDVKKWFEELKKAFEPDAEVSK